MKRTFYVFWGVVGDLARPILLDVVEESEFSDVNSHAEGLKYKYPFPKHVVTTEIELDDFIPMIKLGMIHSEEE